MGENPQEWWDLAGERHPDEIRQLGRRYRPRYPNEVVEVHPVRCPGGHDLVPPWIDVSWLPCMCSLPDTGHRKIVCRICSQGWFRPRHVLRRSGH